MSSSRFRASCEKQPDSKVTAALSDNFGDEAQRALLDRGAQTHLITQNDKRFTYYGRTVGATSPDEVPLSVVTALARLQGNSNFSMISDEEVPALVKEATSLGLVPAHYERWEAGENVLSAARRLREGRGLQSGYDLVQLTRDTPLNLRQSLAQTAQACGVLLPAFSVLTGCAQPGICVMAVDSRGLVAGCAAAAAFLHPEHPCGQRQCWWGMLAVHPKHRGKAISLTLGAEAILGMFNTFGFTEFFTGVEPGNGPSEEICQKTGFLHDGRSILGMADPTLVASGRMTK